MQACADSAPGFRGSVQEEPIPCYADADGDGFGDDGDIVQEVDCPSGYVERGGDCDDAETAAYPDAEEVCDELDNDCDGETDEGLLQTWYLDWDWDGYGDAASPYEACELPPGYSADATDCDDDDNDTYPGAEELCDGLDNDCDGEIDEDWAVDGDGDGVYDCMDPCPEDELDDRDGDGACDSDDPCPDDELDDRDGDGACDSDDPCPDDAGDDSDGDGVCDGEDPCPDDAGDDSDGDGVCDGEDPCPDDAQDLCGEIEQGDTALDANGGGEGKKGQQGCFCGGGAASGAVWLGGLVLLGWRRRGLRQR